MKAISKKDIPRFLNFLIAKKIEIIAPTSTPNGINFEIIKDGNEAVTDYIKTKYPPKKFFIPDGEVIFNYKKNGKDVILPKKIKRRAIFGIRPCDVHGLFALDKVFDEDPYYNDKRKKTLVIAVNCSETGENCFCQSMGTDKIESGYDILLSETKDHYIIDDASTEGKALLGMFKKYDGPKPKKLKNKKKFDSKQIEKRILKVFDEKKWGKVSERCLSCGACNISCPTCYCFSMHDDTGYEEKEGKRTREWSFCMLKNFSRVAGDMFFRRERVERCKQFVYHKLSYFKERHGIHLCVGCGRCVDICPTGIDFFKETEKILGVKG